VNKKTFLAIQKLCSQLNMKPSLKKYNKNVQFLLGKNIALPSRPLKTLDSCRYPLIRDALQAIVTALYCKLLVILGLAFPMAEAISDAVPKGYYQLFYVYLFVGSLLFLLCTYVDMLWTRVKAAGGGWCCGKGRQRVVINDKRKKKRIK